MKSSKLFAGLCLGILGMVAVPPAGLAQIMPQPAASAAQAAAGIGAPIEQLYARITEIEHSSAGFAQRAALLTPTIDRVFNLPVVLQNSLGLRYRTLSEAQKQQLLDQFRQFTVARYVSNFAPGGTDTFKVEPGGTPSAIPGDQLVRSQILAGGASTQINYEMRRGPSGWQVVDVLLNGNISQVAVQRADFGSSLTSGDATPLIESLRKKTQALSES